MKTYLTDLSGLTYVDPSIDDVRHYLGTLIDTDLYDFPEIILSDHLGYSLLISSGYTVVLEVDEEEVGLLTGCEETVVLDLAKGLLGGKRDWLREQPWEDIDG